MTGVADGVGTRGARMRLVQTWAAPGAVPAGLRAMMTAVRAGRTLSAHGVAAAGAAANHAPAWTASAAVRAVPVVPDVRLAFARLKLYREWQMVSIAPSLNRNRRKARREIRKLFATGSGRFSQRFVDG